MEEVARAGPKREGGNMPRTSGYQTAFVASIDIVFDAVSKISTHAQGHVAASLLEEVVRVTGSASYENCKDEVR